MLKEKTISESQRQSTDAVHFLNLAEACLHANQYQEAEHWLVKISQMFPPLKASAAAYHFHHLRGMVRLWQGDSTGAYREARQALQIFRRVHPSLSLPEQGKLPGFVVENLKQLRRMELALLESLEGEPAANENRDKEALERRISEISSHLEHLNPLAKLHQLTGSALLELGKQAESEEHLSRAAIGFRLSADWASLAHTLNKTAQLHHTRGELPRAIQLLKQARVFSIKAKDHYLERILSANVAHCQLLCGIWRPALDYLPLAIAEAKKGKDLPRYLNALLFWGSLNLLRGKLKESRQALVEAQRFASEKNFLGVLKYSHGYLADLCMAEGRLEEAETHLKKVLEICQEVTPQGGPVAEAWQKLGELHLARKEYEQALKSFAVCRDFLSKQPEKLIEGACYRGLGICHVRMDQFQWAQKEFKKALVLFESCGNEWELAKTAVLAVENGAFAAAEIYPKLFRAKEIFKKLEHPAWQKRAQVLLDHLERGRALVPLRLARQLAEKELITQALDESDGNISRAAEKLGILRQSLQYKIKQYKIDA